MSGATGPTAAGRGPAAGSGDGLAPGGVDLALATSLPALHALRPEWERLEAEVDGATVYQTWAWVVSWYEHFGADKRIAVVAARAGGRRLVAVVPLSAAAGGPGRARLLHFLGRGNELTEYVDALVRPEHAGAVTRAVFDWWDARRREWDLWRLPSAPVESPLVRELRAAAAARRYAIVADEATRVTLPLPSSWDAFQAGLGRNMRKHLRKFANRLERDAGPPKLVTVTDVDALDPALEVFFDLHSRRAAADITRRHEERFPTAAHRGFLRAAARRLAERDRLRLWLLEIDGQPVAAQMCFALGRRLYAYHSGYDPRWAWHAVMMFLFRRCIEGAIAEGFQEFDLGLGHDQEKLRWGGQPRPVVHLTLANPRLRSRAALGLWCARQRWRARRAGRASAAGISAPEEGPE